MAKKKKKKKLRIDRVMIVAVVGIALLFGVYKGVTFIANQISQMLTPFSAQTVKEDKKSYIATVVLDPGHGGYDVGANRGTLYEKDITLKTAEAIAESLDKENIKAVLTRTTDTELDDDKTTDLTMRAQFSAKNKAKYFVSIHVNDYKESTDVSGFEVHTRNDESKGIATSIGNHLEALNFSRNRGIVDGKALIVLKENTVPSVLIELGYINGQDYNYLNDDQKLNQIGNAISQGIIEQIKQ